MLGWHFVVNKGEFKVGDKCVYFEIDSILPPDNPDFAFLLNSKGKMKPLKTKKIRGVISQGLVMPLSVLHYEGNIEEGQDVTDILGVQKKEDEVIELNYSELLDKFCDYVQNNKVVNIDALSQKFGTTKEETIKKLREMEKEGQTVGFVDSNGEYFFLTLKEIELLDKLFSGKKKRKFSKGEIEKLFNEICSATGN